MSARTEFEKLLLIERVASRVTVGMEHDSPEALESYLKAHPDADKSKHKVKKTKKTTSGGKKPKQRKPREEIDFTTKEDWEALRSESHNYSQKYTNGKTVTEFVGKNPDGSKWTVVMTADHTKPKSESEAKPKPKPKAPKSKPKPTNSGRRQDGLSHAEREIEDMRDRVNNPKRFGLDPQDDADDIAEMRKEVQRWDEDEIDRKRERSY